MNPFQEAFSNELEPARKIALDNLDALRLIKKDLVLAQYQLGFAIGEIERLEAQIKAQKEEEGKG